MLDTIEQVIGTIMLILSAGTTIFALAAKLSKSKKLRIISENLNLIQTEIQNQIPQAEKYKNYAGLEKKEWVKNKARIFCADNKIPYDDQLVDDVIERAVKMTKTVNVREGETDDGESGS